MDTPTKRQHHHMHMVMDTARPATRPPTTPTLTPSSPCTYTQDTRAHGRLQPQELIATYTAKIGADPSSTAKSIHQGSPTELSLPPPPPRAKLTYAFPHLSLHSARFGRLRS